MPANYLSHNIMAAIAWQPTQLPEQELKPLNWHLKCFLQLPHLQSLMRLYKKEAFVENELFSHWIQ
jgi:hypothetical protein